MPLLDVTQILTDPDFADSFAVRRRTDVIDSHGRSVPTEQTFSPVIGVVTANSPSDLDRKEDYQTMSRSITVVCRFALRGETTDSQPDIVVWRGSNFLVKHVDLYPHFGAGFFQAECSSMNKTDNALQSGLIPQLAFNVAANSTYSIFQG
jgi:hypothetical protein